MDSSPILPSADVFQRFFLGHANRERKSECSINDFERPVGRLLTKRNFREPHFRRRDIPIWPALLFDCTEVLAEVLKRRTAEKPIAVVDPMNDEARPQNDDMGNHRIVVWVCVFGNVEVLLNNTSGVGKERPMGADARAVLVRKSDVVGADRHSRCLN